MTKMKIYSYQEGQEYLETHKDYYISIIKDSNERINGEWYLVVVMITCSNLDWQDFYNTNSYNHPNICPKCGSSLGLASKDTIKIRRK